MFTPSSFEALPRTHCADCGGLIIRDKEIDWCPCLGGSCIGCGEQTNGKFEGGTHGPGYYCGWCYAVPSDR